MVKLFQGIDGEQMLELADFFVHVVETTMDTFWVDGLHLYHDLAKRREDQAAWSGLADMDLIQQVLAHPQEARTFVDRVLHETLKWLTWCCSVKSISKTMVVW